jgi:hypothetical protein
MANTIPDIIGGTVTIKEVAGSEHIYMGDIIALNSSGYLVQAKDVTTNNVIGIAIQEVDNSAGADGDLSISCHEGGYVWLEYAGLDRTNYRDTVYLSTEKIVTTKALTVNKVGVGVLIELDTVNTLAKVKL